MAKSADHIIRELQEKIRVLEEQNREHETIRETLEISEEKYRETFHHANDAMFLWELDEDNNFLGCMDVNEVALKRLGYERHEMDQFVPHNINTEASLEKMPGILAEIDRNGQATFQVEHVTRDGNLIPVEISAHGFRIQGKKVILSISRDITERKHYERQLVEARFKAEEADRLKSAFLANMSHEIRTPLNAILGFSDLLKQRELNDEEKDQYIEIIDAKGRQLLNIITDIIDISKIEANQMTLRKELHNLNHLLDTVYKDIRSKTEIRKKRIRFMLHKGLNDRESLMYFDEFRLNQVLQNLIENAVKFTSKGQIDSGYELVEGDKVRLYVRDTGKGIPEDQRKIIFERFRQVEVGRAKQAGGTGLGLAICHDLVKLMGGELEVDSIMDKGSEFHFTIPFEPGVLEEPVIEEVAPERKLSWPGKKIMIVEDDEFSFEFYKVVLRDKGLEIIRARNGEEALATYRGSSHLDLILMDVQLPILDGLSVCRKIREKDQRTPIIAQTAYAMEDDFAKCIDAGCNDYISKPINVQKLLGLMNRFL